MFLWGGRARLGKKVCNAPRATDFREERNPPQADSIVSNNKLCTIQYCNITIPYCNIVPYYVKSIAMYHIARRIPVGPQIGMSPILVWGLPDLEY